MLTILRSWLTITRLKSYVDCRRMSNHQAFCSLAAAADEGFAGSAFKPQMLCQFSYWRL
jgi:hypothetical protein